jgi:D-psicose/D-tagatose/L-ribulose 3-epimerase
LFYDALITHEDFHTGPLNPKDHNVNTRTFATMHLSSHTWMRPEPLEATLERASRLAYESIELAGEPGKYDIASTRSLFAKYNLSCWGAVTIMHPGRDLIAASEATRSSTISYMREVVNLASGLGGKIITMVPSTVGKTRPEASPEQEWKWAVEGLKEVCTLAGEKGLKVAIEPLNRFETYFINRVDQALAMVDELEMEHVGIAFDPFHLHMEERDIFAAIKACNRNGRTLIHDVHLGDNNRLAPGDGSIDWPRFVETLRSVGYDGGLAAEFMPPIDRTPTSPYKAIGGQIEKDPVGVDPGALQFLHDHASCVLKDRYYTVLLERTRDVIRALI